MSISIRGSKKEEDSKVLLEEIARGDRASIAKGLTLVESCLPSDRDKARLLMKGLWKELSKRKHWSRRIGFVGSPGAGKSSLIGAVGTRLVESGNYRVAVLCVDPSSPLSGGSILGDRVRMTGFAGGEGVFVRGMASGANQVGLSGALTDASVICEVAGFDFILIETGGVGQSQTAVREVVHCLVMVIPPAGGDDLQAMKRGLLEVVDMIAVSKYDSEFLGSANRTFSDMNTMSMMRGGKQKVLRTSVVEEEGIAQLVGAFTAFFEEADRLDFIKEQWQQWMDRDFGVLLQSEVFADEGFARYYESLRGEVKEGKVYAKEAAHLALEKLWKNGG